MKNVKGSSPLRKFWKFVGAIKNFPSGLVTMDENWLYHYDPKQSNNQCSGGIAAHPGQSIPSAKFRWNISRLEFFRSRQHPTNWLFYKRPNCQRGVLLIAASAIEGHFEGKTHREVSQGVLILNVNVAVRRVLAIKMKLSYVGFQYLDHPPCSPDLAPSDYHLFPGLKKPLKVSHISSDV